MDRRNRIHHRRLALYYDLWTREIEFDIKDMLNYYDLWTSEIGFTIEEYYTLNIITCGSQKQNSPLTTHAEYHLWIHINSHSIRLFEVDNV